MQQFTTDHEATAFLVGRIVEQARRDGVAFSQVEQKMLSFSETDSTLPDIAEVNGAFDREYNQAQYESKVARIIRQLRARMRQENAAELEIWNNAVEKLRQGDHYLLVMIDQAGGAKRPRGDLVRLILTGLGISAVLLVLAILMSRQ